MKKTILILSIILSLNLQAQKSDLGWLFINENTIALDKQQHAVGGIFLGTTAYMIAYQGKDKNRKRARFWGIVVPIVGGTLKEFADRNTTGFDMADLGYTVAGGVVATFTFDLLMKRKHKRQNKKIALVN